MYVALDTINDRADPNVCSHDFCSWGQALDAASVFEQSVKGVRLALHCCSVDTYVPLPLLCVLSSLRRKSRTKGRPERAAVARVCPPGTRPTCGESGQRARALTRSLIAVQLTQCAPVDASDAAVALLRCAALTVLPLPACCCPPVLPCASAGNLPTPESRQNEQAEQASRQEYG